MADDPLPTFADLQRRYAGGLASTARPDERDHLIAYLLQLGASVASVADIHEAVLILPHEEELATFRCREGVAVSHASEGWMLLFRHDDPIVAAHAHPMGAGGC